VNAALKTTPSCFPNDQSKTKITLPDTALLNGRYRLGKRLGRGAIASISLAIKI
jgi:hypothetical protein